jgi:fructoselysine and glucoselysine-specific PTS system IIC component
MLIKAILVGLVLGLCKSEWIYGFPQVGRPIVVSTLTGLFLGDPVQGVIMGSVLELMFIGSFPIGAAVSPDYTSAGAICTAFAILTGGGKAVATAMALPIALLGGFIFIGCKLMNAAFGQIMMKYLEKDDSKGASRIYIMGSVFTCFVVYFAYAFVCIFAGSAAVEAAVNAIPKVIINGFAGSRVCTLTPDGNYKKDVTIFLYRIYFSSIFKYADDCSNSIRNYVCISYGNITE